MEKPRRRNQEEEQSPLLSVANTKRIPEKSYSSFFTAAGVGISKEEEEQSTKQNVHIVTFMSGLLLIGCLATLAIYSHTHSRHQDSTFSFSNLEASETQTMVSSFTKDEVRSFTTATTQKELTPEQSSSMNEEQMLPHIFLVLIDDQGFADVGFNSAEDDLASFTPTIDALAKSGLTLDNYYTQQMCTPARAALMTGRYPALIGVDGLALGPTEPWGLPAGLKLLPEYLREAGYETHAVGKWHLGHYKSELLPTNRGFDSHFGFYSGKEAYYTHMLNEANPRRGHFYDWHLDGEPHQEALGQYSTRLIEERVSEVIARRAAEAETPGPLGGGDRTPLFMYIAHQNVHEPEEDPPENYISEEALALIENLPESRQTFAKMTLAADKALARLLQDLKVARIWEQSIVIVASDNGGCSAAGGQNYPLRGQKNSLFEGGVRVNAVVGGGALPAAARGKRYSGLFHVSDWLPSIVFGLLQQPGKDEFAGEGLDLWALAAGLPGADPAAARAELLHGFEVAPSGRARAALRAGDFKVVYGEDPRQAWYTPLEPDELGLCTRSGPEDYAFSSDLMIFNIKEDPYEQHNLAEEMDPLQKSQLWMKLMQYRAKVPKHLYMADDGAALQSWSQQEDKFVRPWI